MGGGGGSGGPGREDGEGGGEGGGLSLHLRRIEDIGPSKLSNSRCTEVLLLLFEHQKVFAYFPRLKVACRCTTDSCEVWDE